MNVRPSAYKIQDPAEWQAKHNAGDPFPLKGHLLGVFGSGKTGYASPAHAYERRVLKAKEILAKDWSTLDTEEVHGLMAELEEICQRVAVLCDVEDKGEVFYNPEDNHFWLYPCKL